MAGSTTLGWLRTAGDRAQLKALADGTLVNAAARARRWRNLLDEGIYATREFRALQDPRERLQHAGAGDGFPEPEAEQSLVPLDHVLEEALDPGIALRIVLRATHEDALDYVSLADLKRHALNLA